MILIVHLLVLIKSKKKIFLGVLQVLTNSNDGLKYAPDTLLEQV
jgi:hypothetical protein